MPQSSPEGEENARLFTIKCSEIPLKINNDDQMHPRNNHPGV